MLDLPGIIEGAAQGKGRGKQVIAVARTADMVLMMLDATKSDVQRTILERELDTMGIRLNTQPPNVYYKQNTQGGIAFTATCPLTIITEKLVHHILHEYKIYHAEIVVREDINMDQLIDVIQGGNVKYLKCLYVYNKIDSITMEEVQRLASMPSTVVISAEMFLGLDYLVECIWDTLGLLRIYTKKSGELPDFGDPLIVRNGASVEHVCHTLHRNLSNIFKYALIWGQSAKHQPQKVGLAHVVGDEDVIQIVKKK